MKVDSLLQQPNEGNGMPYHDPRDPLIETPDSVARARDSQRRQRAEFLIWLFRTGDVVAFDFHFRDYYREDASVLLFLPDDASRRALGLVNTGRRQ